MTRTVKATVELTQNDEGLWLTVEDAGRKATILLAPRGPLVQAIIHAWAESQNWKESTPKMATARLIGSRSIAAQLKETTMHKLIAYLTGTLALLVVAASATSALTYAALHRSETLQNLATSTLSGVGMAVGGCLGSALILRFKAARRFIKSVIKDINEKHA